MGRLYHCYTIAITNKIRSAQLTINYCKNQIFRKLQYIFLTKLIAHMMQHGIDTLASTIALDMTTKVLMLTQSLMV